MCCDKTPKEKIFLNNLGNIYYKKKDYINAIKTFELSYNIDNIQELITEKLANSLVQANFRKQAEKSLLKEYENLEKQFRGRDIRKTLSSPAGKEQVEKSVLLDYIFQQSLA